MDEALVALWPLTGRFGYRDLAFEDWVYGIFSPYNVVSDVIGLAVLLACAWRYGMFQPSRLWAWARTGELRAQ